MTVGVVDDFFLFFGKEDLFSQWNWRGITVKGVFFKTCEHFMMYCKAKLFKDDEIAEEILIASSPREAKRLGRLVKGFDEDVWVQHRLKYVTAACLAKARQYPEVMALLKSTGAKIIVEASPYDGIWGVKLGANDSRILDPDAWRGLNLLGQAWMIARTTLWLEERKAA